MASYVFPGNQNTYVPSLHADMMISYVRNRDKFPINRYVNVRPVEKEIGFYLQFQNSSQNMYINEQDVVWADGNDRPVLTYGNAAFQFPSYQTVRRDYGKRIGYLAVEQAGWNVLDDETAKSVMLGMTHRSKRIADLVCTAANWPSANTATATSLGGGQWSAATSTNPYVKNSLLAAANLIIQNTLGVVQLDDLCLVVNPTTARELATCGEVIDLVKQSPDALNMLQGDAQFAGRYGLPAKLYGITVVVDDTVVNTAQPLQTPTYGWTFGDNKAVVMSKQNAIQSSAGPAFSTVQLFAYEEFVTEVFNDPINRRYDLHVVENVQEILFASMAGYLITST